MPPGSCRTRAGVVLPALRGSLRARVPLGRRDRRRRSGCSRRTPAHGAVALAEHQTEGRGRLGRTWVDSALMFSVALYPAAAGRALARADAGRGPGRRRRRSGRRRDDQAPERRAGRRAQGRRHPCRGGRAGRARDRDQRRRGAPGPARAGSIATGSTCSSTCSTGSSAATTPGSAADGRADVAGRVFAPRAEHLRVTVPREGDRERALRLDLTMRVDWLTRTVTVAGSSRLKRSVFASSSVERRGVDVDRRPGPGSARRRAHRSR